MKYLFSFLISFWGVSCSNSVQSETSEQGSTKTIDTLNKAAQASVDNEDLLSLKILGAWTNHQTENATFDIGKDSILYVDELQSYPYKLIDNKIVIRFPEEDYEAKLSWLGDTLLIVSKGNDTTKFTRFTD